MTYWLPGKPLFLEIPRHLKDRRVDSALVILFHEKFPEEKPISRAVVTRALKEGAILLNNTPVLPRARVATHDILTVNGDICKTVVRSVVPKDSTAIKKLFEDERIVVLEKEAGIQMHQGGAYALVTVADWLLHHYPELKYVGEDPLRPGIVHRLDRDTSGILVVAKDNESFQVLKKSFQERLIEKTYVALVYGHLSILEGSIDASLMRTPGALRRRAIDPKQYQGTLPGNTRTALTLYRVMARYDEYDLVALTPKTGRTHQLRAHLSFLGHPIVGDTVYAFKEVKRKMLLAPGHQLLHASHLALSLFDKKYQFHSPLPQDFRQILDRLDETLVSSYDDEALKSLF